MSRKKPPAPNLDYVNSMVALLSNQITDLESKLKNSERKKKELEDEVKLLNSEIQNKSIEITNLKTQNSKLNISINQLNEKLELHKKEINELKLISKINDGENKELMLKEKNKYEKDKQEIEKLYYDMKLNFENEHQKYLELDRRFYDYKKEYELNKNSDYSIISKLKEELKMNKEDLSKKTKIIEENNIKFKEINDIMKNLQKENERIKSSMEDLKTQSYNKIESMKMKIERASQNVFSTENILNIVGENINHIYEQEFSFSLNKIIEEILKNFIIYTQSIFDMSENRYKKTHNDENIYIYFLKDIYFYIYFYVFNLKKSKQEIDISISSNDYTEEIIRNLTEEIYKNNLIHFSNEDSQGLINDYLNNLKKMGVDDDNLEIIKENYKKKNEKFRIYLLNIIRSLIKKCSDNIRNSTIELNNKILYDFRNYNGDEFCFSKNNLQIYCDKITSDKMEGLINILKYAPDIIIRVHFNNNFNNNLSEYDIQKLLLYLMTYNLDLLSLSFNNCENININLLSYITFIIQNLKKIRILGFESCKLNDNHIKILVDGIKENKTIIALMLRKNNISSQGAFYISEYINKNTNVRQLFLGDNNIREKGLKSLLNIMSTTNKNITNLDLSYNDFKINDFDDLSNYLKTDPILNSLDISGNKIELKSSINLGAVLSGIKNVKSLNMSNMKIISEYIPNLFKNSNLDDIILDDNELEDVGLIMLIKGLEGNKILKKLSLKNTKISFIGVSNLLKILVKLKEFKELHLENNTIDDTCINIIKTTLKTKQFKIFVSKVMVNQDLFKEDILGKESNIVMV